MTPDSFLPSNVTSFNRLHQICQTSSIFWIIPRTQKRGSTWPFSVSLLLFLRVASQSYNVTKSFRSKSSWPYWPARLLVGRWINFSFSFCRIPHKWSKESQSYSEYENTGGREFLYFYNILFTNPSARAGYDTRSIFKRSLTCLNSEFSFS